MCVSLSPMLTIDDMGEEGVCVCGGGGGNEDVINESFRLAISGMTGMV